MCGIPILTVFLLFSVFYFVFLYFWIFSSFSSSRLSTHVNSFNAALFVCHISYLISSLYNSSYHCWKLPLWAWLFINPPLRKKRRPPVSVIRAHGRAPSTSALPSFFLKGHLQALWFALSCWVSSLQASFLFSYLHKNIFMFPIYITSWYFIIDVFSLPWG